MRKTIMGRSLALVAVMALLLSSVRFNVYADGTSSFTDKDGIEYRLNASNHTAVVVDGKNCTEKSIMLGTVEEDEEEYHVVSVSKNAFKGNKYCQQIYVDGTCKTIGAGAFSNMPKLKSAYFGYRYDGTFDDTPGTQAKVTVGKNAFSGCKKLEEIYTSSTYVKSIGKNAFKGTKKNMTVLLAVYGKNYKNKKQFDKIAKKQIKKYKKLLKNSGAQSVKFEAEMTDAGSKIYSY